MISFRVSLVFAACLALGAGAVVSACGDDASSTPEQDGGGGTSSGSSGASGSSGSTSSSGSSGQTDSGGTDGGGGAVEVDGGGPCGSYDFGKPAAPFGPVDASDTVYDGGVLAPGIYDAVLAERNSGLGGSWRETLAVDEKGRFSRIRQIDTGAGPGNVTNHGGTVTTDTAKAEITFKEDCLYRNGNPADAGGTTGPYEIVQSGGAIYLKYGFALFRITLQRR